MQLEKLIKFHGRRGPVLVVVADGVGLAEDGPANALSIANTPVMDGFINSTQSTRLFAHGTHVGLPTDDDMGNSEVGHNTLGGGRIFDQGAKLVNSAFESGFIFESESWQQVENRGAAGGTIHFLGLLSDGNVHSHIKHLLDLVTQCHKADIQSVCVHALLDGRDVDPRSALTYLNQLQDHLDQVNSSGSFNYRIASGGGRMVITMDRYDADWEMVRTGFNLHVHGDPGETGIAVASATTEVQRQYDANEKISDQYLAPFVVVSDGKPVGAMKDGDGVVLFNFRGDRAIEISRALEQSEFDKFDRGNFADIYFCGMLQYDGDLNVPENFLVNPPVIEQTMVEYMCAENLSTFAVSETQKFGHVTYFWNGNKSGYIDKSLESYIEIPSDNCAFDEAPEMKAVEITDATIGLLNSGEYRFGRINFANGDMVGHTGNIPATVQALECVDRCLGRLVDCIRANNGILVFTADHGNADEMFVEKDGKRVERTAHSLNQVPFAIFDSGGEQDYTISKDQQGGLANVAATVFNLMGYRAPQDYMPSLISIKNEPTRRTIYKGSIVNLGLETVSLPNQELMALEIVRHPGGAVIVAVDNEGKICMVKQFRHAAGGWIWELPAGILDPGESAEFTARRELKEETGCIADEWTSLGRMYTSPGFCDEILHAFLARSLEKGAATPEAHEFIEIYWLSVPDIEKMISDGTIIDAKSIVAIHLAARQLEEYRS